MVGSRFFAGVGGPVCLLCVGGVDPCCSVSLKLDGALAWLRFGSAGSSAGSLLVGGVAGRGVPVGLVVLGLV